MRGENSFSSLNTHQRTRLTASRASSASSFTMLSFNEPAFLPYEPIPHEELLRILNSDAQSGFPLAAVDFSFEGFQAFDDLPPPLPFRPLPIPLRSLAGPSFTEETSYPSTEIGESSTGSSPNEFGGRRGEQERSWLNLRASTSRKESGMFANSLVIKFIRLPSLETSPDELFSTKPPQEKHDPSHRPFSTRLLSPSYSLLPPRSPTSTSEIQISQAHSP